MGMNRYYSFFSHGKNIVSCYTKIESKITFSVTESLKKIDKSLTDYNKNCISCASYLNHSNNQQDT